MINVDLNEIKKFEKLTEKWWDPEGSMKPLHAMNPVRVEYIKSHTILTNKRVLDIGCGGGILSEEMSRFHASVTAIDLNKNAITLAKEHARQEKISIDYRCESLENLSKGGLHDNHFDLITCMEVLEHVPDPLKMLNKLSKLVKKKTGKIIVSTINRTMKSYLGAVILAEYALKLLPKGTHEYRKFIKPSELESWGKATGLNMLDIKGVGYDPILNKAYFKEDVSVNYILCYNKGV